MGKRLRSLSIQFGDEDIRITKHAMRRFQSRVQYMPLDDVPRKIAAMLKESVPSIRSSQSDARYYFKHEQCVFVMTPNAVIVTVLNHHAARRQFSTSIKSIRREKKQRNTNPVIKRRLSRNRHQRQPRSIREPEHDDDMQLE